MLQHTAPARPGTRAAPASHINHMTANSYFNCTNSAAHMTCSGVLNGTSHTVLLAPGQLVGAPPLPGYVQASEAEHRLATCVLPKSKVLQPPVALNCSLQI